MRVTLAETAGFCMGVDLALTKLDELLRQRSGAPLYTLGPIIHNPQVLERYKAQGVLVVERPEDLPAGSHVVIRAHGVPRQVEAGLHEAGIRVEDATCPRVKKAQVLIRRHTSEKSGQNPTLLLYGEADHPEVRGLLSYAEGKTLVFGSRAEFDALDLAPGRYVLAAQTTQDKAEFSDLVQALEEQGDLDVTVLQTICDATKLRQREAMDIAETVDAMVVVGGRMSGNTRRLVQVCAGRNVDCFHVEIPEELPLDELRGRQKVGLTAGASTPADLIAAVRKALAEL